MNKKEKVNTYIKNFTNEILDKLEENNNIDFFNIKISNHQGNIQADYTIRERLKVY